MVSFRCFRVLFLFCVVFLAQNASFALEIQEVRVGIDGYYKTGIWTPITLKWGGEGSERVSRVDVRTFDSDGTPILLRNEGISPKSEDHSTTVYAKFGRAAGEIRLELYAEGDDSPLASRHVRPEKVEIRGHARANNAVNSAGVQFFSPVPQERPVFLVIGSSDSGLQDAVGLLRLKESQRPVIVQIDSLEKLPPHHKGLDGVELIVLTTTLPEMWTDRRADDPVITAMHQWMHFGGQLLFVPGKASEPFLGDSDAPLAPFLPGRFERMVELRQGKPIELYSVSNRSIIMEGNEAAPYIRMPFFSDIKGTVELAEADLPLVVKRPVGFGSLIYFGGDLADPPLSDWRDRGLLILKLLNMADSQTKTTEGQHSMVHLGFHDLSGQIRSSLDEFEGVSPLPFSLVLLLIVLYIVVIAPLDWLLVHRLLKRPQLTWFTFPLWVVLFCCLAFALNKPNREKSLAVNSVDLIDFAPREQLMRVHTWGSVFSPKDARYDLVLANDAPEAKERELHWLGLSGSGLGGMDPKTVSPTLWDEPYTFREQEPEKLEGVPMRVRSTKSFFGRWNTDPNGAFEEMKSETQTKPLNHYFKDLQFQQREGIPHGTFTNELPVALDNALLVYGFWVLKLGRLESGQSVELSTKTTRRELRMILNSTELGFDENRATGGVPNLYSYNMEARELWPILRTMSFYKVFGGFDSIGLHNAMHSRLDLSDSLHTGRAVFVAEVDTASASYPLLKNRLEIPSDSPSPGKQAAVVRIVLPVE